MDKENKPFGDQPGNKNNYHKNRKKKYYNKNKQNLPKQNDAIESKTEKEKTNDIINENKPNQNTQKKHNNRHHKKHKGNRPHNNQAPKSAPEVIEAEKFAVVENEVSYNEPEIALNTEDIVTTAEESEPLAEIIGVRFKEGGKTYYFAPNGIIGKKGEYVIVETARGLEFGEISVANSMVRESEFVPPLRPVIRIATKEDIEHHNENNKKQDEAFKICNEKIIAHELEMKLIDAQYTFDNSKLLFYFTSSGRVDFRELVKDLAAIFKTRIELRQIGIRDEAKIIGGLGICGRPLCCSLFLTDFGQVSIKMAKEQNLSLNSAKISGACGRLMCCLRYEYDTYVQEIKKTPSLESKVKTADGIGTVVEINPLAGKIKVRLDDKPEQAPKSYLRDSVTPLPKQK